MLNILSIVLSEDSILRARLATFTAFLFLVCDNISIMWKPKLVSTTEILPTLFSKEKSLNSGAKPSV